MRLSMNTEKLLACNSRREKAWCLSWDVYLALTRLLPDGAPFSRCETNSRKSRKLSCTSWKRVPMAAAEKSYETIICNVGSRNWMLVRTVRGSRSGWMHWCDCVESGLSELRLGVKPGPRFFHVLAVFRMLPPALSLSLSHWLHMIIWYNMYLQ